MEHIVKRSGALLATLVVALFVMSCVRPLTAPSAAAENDAQVRWVNVAPGSDAVDLYLDGDQIVTGLAFAKSSKFGAVTAGTHDLQIVPAGEAPSADTPSKALEFKPELTYETVIFTVGSRPSVQPFAVTLRSAGADKVRLRVVHAAPDAGSLDVIANGGSIHWDDVQYGGATSYTKVEPGPVEILVNATGTDTSLLEPVSATLKAGRVYDLFLLGRASDDTLQAVFINAKVSAPETVEAGPPTSAETAYLDRLAKHRDFLMLSLTQLDSLLQDMRPGDNTWDNTLALVFEAWIIADRDLREDPAPERYAELKAAYLSVLEPLAAVATQQSNAADYLSGAADLVSFNLDLNALLNAVVGVLPQLEDADVKFEAARQEAGLPPLG